MKKLTFGSLFVIVAFATMGAASAQSIHHDKMDARAARADIQRLKIDRKMARRAHNWGKVKQDTRLINADMKFVHKDHRKIVRAES